MGVFHDAGVFGLGSFLACLIHSMTTVALLCDQVRLVGMCVACLLFACYLLVMNIIIKGHWHLKCAYFAVLYVFLESLVPEGVILCRSS